MITSETIRRKDFTRGVRGYKEEEVDQFLDMIAEDIDALISQNETLKARIKERSQETERSRGSEATLLNTLEAAKALMADISLSAEKRAEILLKNAELDAERIRREARESVENITEEAKALSRRWDLFSSRFRNLLETELDRFDSFKASALFDDEPSPAAEIGGGHGQKGTLKFSASAIAAVGSDKTAKSTRQL